MMKNLLIDYDDIEYLYNNFKDLEDSTIIRLKEMLPNRNTLRIIKEKSLSTFQKEKETNSGFKKSAKIDKKII